MTTPVTPSRASLPYSHINVTWNPETAFQVEQNFLQLRKLVSALLTTTSGASGSAGATGPQGPAGTLGPPGWDGGDGEEGRPGVPGLPGAPGARGASGMPGWDGLEGDEGPMGTPGPPGLQGATGATGAPGPAGSGSGGSSVPFIPYEPDDPEIPYMIPGPAGPGASGAGVGTRVAVTLGVVAQAATDGLLTLVVDCGAGGAGNYTLKADGVNPPTTERGSSDAAVASHPNDTVTVVVRSGEFYKIFTNSTAGVVTTTAYFTPLVIGGTAGVLTPLTLDQVNNRVGINNTSPATALDVISTGSVITSTRQSAGTGANANAHILKRDTTVSAGTPTASDAVGFLFQLPQTNGTFANVASVRGLIESVTNNVATGALVFCTKPSGDPTTQFEAEVARLTSGAAFSLKGSGHPQGVVAAALGSLYCDQATGKFYRKMGGGTTAYGWYLDGGALVNAGVIGPTPWVHFPSGVQANTGQTRGNGFGYWEPSVADAVDAFTWTGGPTMTETYVSGKRYVTATSAATSGTVISINTTTAANTPRLVLDDDIDVWVDLRTGPDVTNIRIWFGISSAVVSNTATLGSASNGSICLRYSTAEADGGWIGATQINGAANQSKTGTVNAIVASTQYRLRVRFVRSGTPTAYFSVNDGTELSLTGNIPATGSTYFLVWGFIPQTNAAKALSWRSFAGWIGS